VSTKRANIALGEEKMGKLRLLPWKPTQAKGGLPLKKAKEIFFTWGGPKPNFFPNTIFGFLVVEVFLCKSLVHPRSFDCRGVTPTRVQNHSFIGATDGRGQSRLPFHGEVGGTL